MLSTVVSVASLFLYADLLVKSASILLLLRILSFNITVSMNGFPRIFADEHRESMEPSRSVNRLGLKRHPSGELIVVVLPEYLFSLWGSLGLDMELGEKGTFLIYCLRL